MVRPERQQEPALLTELELAIMRIIWKLGRATVHEILENLPQDRALAYTTVSTVARLLVNKGFVEAEKESRAHIYLPAMDRPTYENRTIHHVVDGLFDGKALALVRRLVDSESLSDQELTQVSQLIEQVSQDDAHE